MESRTGSQTRRSFVRTTATAAGALALAGRGFAESPNERVRLAVLGVNGRGKKLSVDFSRLPNAEIVALADPDGRLLDAQASALEESSGKKPDCVQDFRTLLDRKDVDAIVVATPDHWHALATVWGCQAGKDVYVEKPVSHNLREGQQMIEAASRYDRVVQVGTQRRSAPFLEEARKYALSGKLGKIAYVHSWVCGNRPAMPKTENEPTPEGVDYDLWQGPAEKRPFNPNRFHYKWHWDWDYGTGELGNNGIHGIDLARALLDLGLPHRVTSGGGTNFYDDDHQTPDTQIVTWEFPKLTMMWEHRMWGGGLIEGSAFGVALHGDQGVLLSDGNNWTVRHGKEETKHSSDSGYNAHLKNFLECVRSREQPNGSIEEGHASTAVCHVGNIAHRLRKNLEFDPEKQIFTADGEANSLLSREHRHPYDFSTDPSLAEG